ncbi:hypothetical protein LOK49_LG02G01405 [Camellia lanceoleosa]|uniref:Uncharacterized protein n=1 Tax=Camellia lanceoleosa TaxID=1840588 RepID=A0ACC0IKT8_9ERIC|nr:hypothetical protein LOK49_LG02G01405 [Camellia lanceoleosa]
MNTVMFFPQIRQTKEEHHDDLTRANDLAAVVLQFVVRFRSCRSNDVTWRWWLDLSTAKSHPFSLTTTASPPSTWFSSTASASSPPASFKEKAIDPPSSPNSIHTDLSLLSLSRSGEGDVSMVLDLRCGRSGSVVDLYIVKRGCGNGSLAADQMLRWN